MNPVTLVRRVIVAGPLFGRRVYSVLQRIGRIVPPLTPQQAIAAEGIHICIWIAYGIWNGKFPGPVTAAAALRKQMLEDHSYKWSALAGKNVLTPVPVPEFQQEVLGVQPHGKKVVALIQVVPTIVGAVVNIYYLPIKSTTSVNYLVPLLGAIPLAHCLPNNSIGVVAAPYQIVPEVIKAAARVVPNQGKL